MMLETLLQILSWDVPSPEIGLEDDGDIMLDWPGLAVNINREGSLNWAQMSTGLHGTDIAELELACRTMA